MNNVDGDWGQPGWNELHFPVEQLDTSGDTWGFRWRATEKWRHARTLGVLKPLLRGSGRKEVLDIGCALCDFTSMAWRLNPQNHFSGMDPVTAAIDWGRRKFPQFDLRVGSIPAIPFDRKFDVILCMEVLCYLGAQGRRDTIQNIFESLNPDGVIVFSGVLNAGAKHHTAEEALGLIGGKFRISRVVYNHWAVHRRIVQVPLDSVYSRLEGIREKLELAPEPYEQWRSTARRPVAAVIEFGRRLAPVSRWPVTAMMAVADFLRRRSLLAMLGHGLSRVFRSNEFADEIIIVGRKSPAADLPG